MTDGERLEALKRFTGLTWKAIAEKANIKYAQSFTDIRAGRHGISPSVGNKLADTFPQIRREWLMLGIGPMTTDEAANTIPLYNKVEDLTGNTVNVSASESINVGSCFPKAELALRNINDSMAEYPVGCILVLKRVMDVNLLLPGHNYLVETEEFAIVRRLQKGSDNTKIALYSTNDTAYQDGKLVYEPFEIPLDSVSRVFTILGYIFTQSSELGK